MPYSRYNPRRRYRGNRAILHKDMGTVTKALALAMATRKLINTEYKSFQVDTPAVADSVPTLTNLTAIAQGDDFLNRDGNKIRIKALQMQGVIAIHASATTSSVRLLIFRDNNGSTTAPVIGDLFTDGNAFTGNNIKLGDPQMNSRFSILYDRFYNLDQESNPRRTVKFYRRLDHHAYFTGTAATDEGKGSLWLIIGSNEGTNNPALDINTMVKFIDN